MCPACRVLGVPALQETDAELGVANPGETFVAEIQATAMPSNLALASSFEYSTSARRQAKASAAKRAPKASLCCLAERPI